MQPKATTEEEERIAIFVDGSNLYHYLKELGLSRLLEFDYAKFAAQLAQGRHVVSATYYIGKVREDGSDKSRRLMASQQRLVSRLNRYGWTVEYGHMLKNRGVYHEKGVDVHLAVDLLQGAHRDLYETAVLVSSDTDLIPAVKAARDEGKRVEYVGFSNRPSLGLINHSHIRTLLKREDLEPLLP